MRRHPFLFAVCLILTLTPIAANAQGFGTPETFYADGVEAYFRGCFAEAESAFSSLMAVDPLDPRAFYFRALILARQGRCDEARADMEIGAQLEAESPNRFDIGKMLERVQGPTRLMLEQYRRRARQLTALVPPVNIQGAPDSAVLREHRVTPLDEYARPGAPQSVVAPPPPRNDNGIAKPVLPPPASPTQPSPPPNPFNDEATSPPAAKEKPQAAPPAAAEPLPPAPKPPAPEPKPALKVEDDQNPF